MLATTVRHIIVCHCSIIGANTFVSTGLSINEIATKLNFASQSFFGKYFKQRVGVSPSRYKIWDGRTEESMVNENMLFNETLAANDNK